MLLNFDSINHRPISGDQRGHVTFYRGTVDKIEFEFVLGKQETYFITKE